MTKARVLLVGLDPDKVDYTQSPVPDHVQDAVRTLLSWAGDDPSREGLLDTPARVVRAIMRRIGYKSRTLVVNDALIDLLRDSLAMSLAAVPRKPPRPKAMACAGVTEVPTFAESGLEGVDVDMWYGVLAPARTPRAVVTVTSLSARPSRATIWPTPALVVCTQRTFGARLTRSDGTGA